MWIGLLLAGAIVLWWTLYTQEVRREWPGRELKNAVTLGRRLWPYHEAHGKYPEHLRDLVADGTLQADEFDSLRFRSAPGAAPEDWEYRFPAQPGEIAIMSPRSIRDIGYWVVSRADGGGEVIWSEPVYKHLRNKIGEQAGGCDGE